MLQNKKNKSAKSFPGQSVYDIAVKVYQDANLRRIIKHAYTYVPYYRELFDSVNLKPSEINSVKDLGKIPFTKKNDLIDVAPKQRSALGVNLSKQNMRRTSGSSGQPFCFWLSKSDLRCRGLCGLRAHLRHGIGHNNRTLIIRDAHGAQNKKSILRRLGILDYEFMDISSDPRLMLERLTKNNFDIIGGATSELAILADEIISRKIQVHTPKLIFSGAEFLDNTRRDKIHRAFGTDPCDMYGAMEVGHVSAQCPERLGYHLNHETMIVEIIRDGKPCPAGEEGEVVITHLFQKVMPFIRYNVGDMAIISPTPCTCGRPTPIMERVSGRMVDCLLLPSGQRVSPYSCTTAIEVISELKGYQITQCSPLKLQVLFVAEATATDIVEQQIKSRLQPLVGAEFDIETKRVSKIDKESRKFKVVQCLIEG